MTVTNPDRSRTLAPLERSFMVSFFVHVVLGYSLYFTAWAQAEPLAWAIGAIEQLKPTLRALETAARLSDHPFPAQVMILYTAISSVLLTMYWGSYLFFVKHIRQEMYRHYRKQLQQTGFPIRKRLGFAAGGVMILFVFGYYVPVDYFIKGGVKGGVVMDSGRVFLRATTLFAPSILSATLLLVLSAIAAAALVISPWAFYLSIARFKSSTSTRR